MNSGTIRSNIRYNEDLLDEYSAERKAITEAITELEALKQKYSTLQDKFGERQEKRKASLLAFSETAVSNKITSSYYTGMNDMLTDSTFVNSYDGLSAAKQKIDAKIQERQQALDDCEANIAYRNERVSYWETQLRLCLAEEAKEKD